MPSIHAKKGTKVKIKRLDRSGTWVKKELLSDITFTKILAEHELYYVCEASPLFALWVLKRDVECI